MKAPFATWVGGVPATNFSTQAGPKIGQVCHVIVGTAASAVAEFQTPGKQLSAHFVVCGPGDVWPDGTILQLLDTDDCCYAQGAGNYPPTAYIGVENAGVPTTAMSAAQIAANARILSWAAGVHGFPVRGPVEHGTPGLTPHCHPNGTPDPAWGNHTCPGPLRLAQMSEIVAQAQPQPTEKDYTIMDSVVLADGTIVSHAVTPQGHYLEITRKAGTAGQSNTADFSIIDVTDLYNGFPIVAP